MPSAAKRGWPWTEETPALEAATSVGEPAQDPTSWPRISIITPSYNQGQFLEETIRSVLLQGYPKLEYIVIDGGSGDDSLDIIRKYEPWLAYWVSEADQGQSHAINKGLARSSGDIVAWLNSDDVYLKGTLFKAARGFAGDPQASIVHGDVIYVDKDSARLPLGIYRSKDTTLLRKLLYWRGWDLPQPAVFFTRELYRQLGELDQTLQYALDYDYFLRAALRYRFHRLPEILAMYRLHGTSKTGLGEAQKPRFYAECHRVVRRYIKRNTSLYWSWRVRYTLRGPLGVYSRMRSYSSQVWRSLFSPPAASKRRQ